MQEDPSLRGVRCKEMLDERITRLEADVERLQEHRRSLGSSADKKKLEIQETCRELLGVVHRRQTQLLRQADYFQGYQLSRVDLHLARAHHAMGTLRCLANSVRSVPSRFDLQIDSLMPPVDKVELPNDLRVKLDASSLRTQIQNFGHVEIEGIMNPLETGYFPESEEEYTEANRDHHVMVKPLNDEKPKLTFPQLGEMQKWLANKRREVSYNGAPEVGQWLQHIKNETCPEPALDECDWNEFEVIEKGGSSVGSDGIEILSTASTPTRQTYAKAQDERSKWLLPYGKSSPTPKEFKLEKDWLLVAPSGNSSQNNGKVADSNPPSGNSSQNNGKVADSNPPSGNSSQNGKVADSSPPSIISSDIRHIRRIFSRPSREFVVPKTSVQAAPNKMAFHMQHFRAMQNSYDWVLKSPVAA